MKLYNDAESRKLIVTNFTSTLFVEAGAGSGKTTSMVSRIMAIILKGHAEIHKIVAITFTNEGAASLKLKIRRELEQANRSDKYTLAEGIEIKICEKEKKLLTNAIRFLPLAQFSTIHSFCLSILKERPIEVGIDPDFDMESEREIVSTFDEYWTRFLIRQAFVGGPLSKIIDEEIDLETLREMALIKCTNPNLDFYLEKVEDISKEQLHEAIKQIKHILNSIKPNLDTLLADNTSGAGLKRFSQCSKYLEALENADNYKQMKAFLNNVPLPDIGGVKKYAETAEAFENIGQITDTVRKTINDYRHNIIVPVVNEFEKYFVETKKKHSNLDFDDLLSLTAQLLQSNIEVRKYFKEKYKYIFVDETQDTDPLQTESMFFLSEKPGQYADKWQDVELEPSKLFMVGDPKQSIYKFRKADVQVYEKTKDLVASQGGKILGLTRNFRSHKNIIEFVNEHFEKSFLSYKEEQKSGIQAKYAPLQCSAANQANCDKNIYHLIASGSNNDQVIDAEISKIISLVKKLVGNEEFKTYDKEEEGYRKLKYSDIMILYRGFTYIDNYTTNFEIYDIPHQVVGGKTFFNTEDVRGLVYTLKAIDEPSDNLSLYAALRSPVFGVPDKELFEFVASGKRLSLFANSEDDDSETAKLINKLKDIYKKKKYCRPSDILRKIFDLSGLCHLSLIEPNGPQKASRYYRVLELLLEIEEMQSLSFSRVVEKLTDIMNSDDPGMANVSLSKVGEDAIKLISIHKSKGLESPVIILAGSQFSGSKGGANHFVLRESGQIVIPYKSGGFYSLKQSELEQLELTKSICEDERLRYVAATRAKDVLAISTSEKGDFNGRFTDNLQSLPTVEDVPFLSDEEIVNVVKKESIDAEEIFAATLSEKQLSIEELEKKAASIKPKFYSVHDLMEYDKSVFADGNRVRRGKAFGNLLHRMMEQYLRGNMINPDSVIDTWIDEEGVRKKLKKDALEMFYGFIKNEYVIEAKAAVEKYCEWEFFYKEEDGRIINGVIDVIYKNPAGEWIILDFKTDDVSDTLYKAKVDEIYLQQMEIYKECFESLTSKRIKEYYLIYSNK